MLYLLRYYFIIQFLDILADNCKNLSMRKAFIYCYGC